MLVVSLGEREALKTRIMIKNKLLFSTFNTQICTDVLTWPVFQTIVSQLRYARNFERRMAQMVMDLHACLPRKAQRAWKMLSREGSSRGHHSAFRYPSSYQVETSWSCFLRSRGKSYFVNQAICWGFSFSKWASPGGSVVKNPPANVGNAGDTGSIPGL